MLTFLGLPTGGAGMVGWSGGTGLSFCDMQVAGSIPVATRSCDPPYHRGFGDCCLTWNAAIAHMTDV